MKTRDQNVFALASKFIRVIQSWGTLEQLRDIDKRNAEYAALADDHKHRHCCATDDIWDSNEAMITAWESVIRREMDFASEADADLINAARDAAKRCGFSTGVKVWNVGLVRESCERATVEVIATDPEHAEAAAMNLVNGVYTLLFPRTPIEWEWVHGGTEIDDSEDIYIVD
tara:strand:- start:2471 stop:2986 length:516 start_codon:yes stop_codon:yes gene_type:complete